MARPTTGRRLHTPAFDEICRREGMTCARIAKDHPITEGHLSDLRSGRRSVTPPVAKLLADVLNVGADVILWPAAAHESAAA